MSTLPDNEFNLEKLFLPAWAQEEPAASKYAKYDMPDDRGDRGERRDRRGPRPPRRDGGGFGPRRDANRPRGDRPPGPGGGPGGAPGRDRSPQGDRRGPRRDFRRDEPRERREPAVPLPEVNVSLVPDPKGVESLARQIRMTGRAYPLFDIAQMILQKPERHSVTLSIRKDAEGKALQPLFLCALDDSLWLSEEEAVQHILLKHFDTFYQTEKTPTEPPKGKYTFVAQCGMSGTILGPPNHHDYQNQLRKLHAERFSRLPFDAFKARVKIVREEEVVKKWIEEQSFKTDFITLNMPEAQRLDNMEAVENHFRETHKENIIKPVESHSLAGVAARSMRNSELARAVRVATEDQRRFPLQIATVLSQQFASHGLQFFKVNKTVTHVCIARPHYLDLAAAPVSEGVKQIVQFIDAHPRCTRKTLVEALAPTPPAGSRPAPPPAAEPAPGEAPEPAPAEGGQPAAPAAPAPAPAPSQSQATPEQTAVITDLHWLIHQGHVIEFANGVLETAKKPAPRPPKPEPKPAPAPALDKPRASETSPAAESAAPLPEGTAAQVEAAVEAVPESGSDSSLAEQAPAEPPPTLQEAPMPPIAATAASAEAAPQAPATPVSEEPAPPAGPAAPAGGEAEEKPPGV